MRLIHAGLVSRSEERADRFFVDLLGLEKTRKSELPAELAKPLFGVEEGCEIVYYQGEDLVLEVFLTGRPEVAPHRISHPSLEVESRSELLARCAETGVAVREARKGDRAVVFIEDGDGNLYEIKES
jgi:catechol 2,3-dioxygenase-like lactoylglutathione lyase family enzyme